MEKKTALTGEGVLYAILQDEIVEPIVNVPNQPISSTLIYVGYSTLNEGAAEKGEIGIGNGTYLTRGTSDELRKWIRTYTSIEDVDKIRKINGYRLVYEDVSFRSAQLFYDMFASRSVLLVANSPEIWPEKIPLVPDKHGEFAYEINQ
ncbi:hypothetical protein [Bacillus velezensis]|uniref:hypothetical protein n=1 Tax=Bacillus velezensis TaxID=492670 RepID=UPI0011AC6A73|nr:hypothetical protein [Bacillus velezensis]TWO89674.1 hypothetical protein EUA42_13995 [Bacillus velezensis]